MAERAVSSQIVYPVSIPSPPRHGQFTTNHAIPRLSWHPSVEKPDQGNRADLVEPHCGTSLGFHSHLAGLARRNVRCPPDVKHIRLSLSERFRTGLEYGLHEIAKDCRLAGDDFGGGRHPRLKRNPLVGPWAKH